MNHRFLEDRIVLYVDGDLPAGERQRCEEHLRTCPRCLERVNVLRSAWVSDGLMPVQGPTLRLRTRFEAVLRGDHSDEAVPPVLTRLAWLARPAMMAATLTVGILIGAYLGSAPDGQTSQVEPLPMDANVLAFSLGEDLQEVSVESVGQDYLLLDWDDPVDGPE